MTPIRLFLRLAIFCLAVLARPLAAQATTPPEAAAPVGAYVLGDSVASGLQLAGLEAQLQTELGGPARINFDGGRSITTPGSQIKKSALESVGADKDQIARSGVIIIVLGMNLTEKSFTDSQQVLMTRLKTLAPKARYFWVDIGATVSTHAALWSARNKIIYDNADPLGYQVISRYKAIFGPEADPLNITPGLVFPGMVTEEGYTGPGSVHGAYPELTEVILDTLSGVRPITPRGGGSRPAPANCPVGL